MDLADIIGPACRPIIYVRNSEDCPLAALACEERSIQDDTRGRRMPTEVARHVVLAHTEPREAAVRRHADNAAVLVVAGSGSKRAEPKSPPFLHPRQTIRAGEHVVPQPLLDHVRNKDHGQNASGEDGELR